ncbi:MAG: tRNA uridine-5-carboxymethylaminomethyl(34) synthesis enzyme MnmG [Chloroflexota bacterium]|nr:tRNA uridine-5-carboxymethylaminomethyl(34) synthesis enzyme MnmG [Chloroflexota bacterium]
MTRDELTTAEYDVLVVGAGHAGCEASLAAARAGATVLCVTPNLDRVGFMPCNPSVGGPGKSQIVAEIDALGGAMGEIADLTALQVRRLNTSKGPAVQAVRHQVDKSLYALAMKRRLEEQRGLALAQDEAVGFTIDVNGGFEVDLRTLGSIRCRSVVITAGTFLRAAMISGEGRTSGGRAGDRADTHLASSLVDLGIGVRRFKTGTPPRIDGRTVDFSELEVQPGDDMPSWFSRLGRTGNITPLVLPPAAVHTPFASKTWRPQLACHRVATNEEAHDLIRSNLHRAPMFNGAIEGAGPRYCPSIEDKVARYPDKSEHPIFLEPEGWQTNELYVQGLSTSLPADVQIAVLHAIPGLEEARITRFGYAVEYDAVDANALDTTLAARAVPGLFLAGQVNGTSGYEEAAGQGLIAGLNAARFAQGQELVTLYRADGYIGVMIDDLVHLPFSEPYRMLTARAEYRLLLRSDSAERRLNSRAAEWKLIDSERAAAVSRELDVMDSARRFLEETAIRPNSDEDRALQAAGQVPVAKPMPVADLMRRPSLTLDTATAALPDVVGRALRNIPTWRLPEFESDLKYAAFTERERREVARMMAMDGKALPTAHLESVPGLRNEARQALDRVKPRTYGEAQRIAGVTPSDIAALLIHESRSDHVNR